MDVLQVELKYLAKETKRSVPWIRKMRAMGILTKPEELRYAYGDVEGNLIAEIEFVAKLQNKYKWQREVIKELFRPYYLQMFARHIGNIEAKHIWDETKLLTALVGTHGSVGSPDGTWINNPWQSLPKEICSNKRYFSYLAWKSMLSQMKIAAQREVDIDELKDWARRIIQEQKGEGEKTLDHFSLGEREVQEAFVTIDKLQELRRSTLQGYARKVREKLMEAEEIQMEKLMKEVESQEE